MRHFFVPAVLLAAVALSSSNVLPMLAELQRTNLRVIDGQQDDNIFSNRFNTIESLRSLFKDMPYDTSPAKEFQTKINKYITTNNNRADGRYDSVFGTEDNYDGEGFRKEQWHNYPRQLDRLHEFLFDDYKTSKQSPDDPYNTNNNSPEVPEIDAGDIATNEYVLDGNKETDNVYDAPMADTNPLLIFKVQLSSLDDNMKNKDSTKYLDLPSIHDHAQIYNTAEEALNDEINEAVKVKREGTPLQEAEILGDNGEKKKTVNKRLFSLWSRLQSLSPKGHELQHRRHLHAFYGLGDGEGGGVETRATLGRPPGSPLRWG